MCRAQQEIVLVDSGIYVRVEWNLTRLIPQRGESQLVILNPQASAAVNHCFAPHFT